MNRIEHKIVESNGIKIHVAEAGEGPLVIMVHGFPETWYSWRNQIRALADAGYHAVAMDLRGVGDTEYTPEIADYSILNLSKDALGIIDAFGARQAVVIGHDWDAHVTWELAQIYPERVNAVVALSVPYFQAPPGPIERLRQFAPDKFNFAVYFQEEGIAEAELENNPLHTIKSVWYSLSGDAPEGLLDKLFKGKPADSKMLEGMIAPDIFPPWITDEDITCYANAYKKSGFTGILNIYRNIDSDYEKLRSANEHINITQPVLFIGGEFDGAVRYGSLNEMKSKLPNLRKSVVLSGCGHWVQEEQANEVNRLIIDFLNSEVKNR